MAPLPERPRVSSKLTDNGRHRERITTHARGSTIHTHSLGPRRTGGTRAPSCNSRHRPLKYGQKSQQTLSKKGTSSLAACLVFEQAGGTRAPLPAPPVPPCSLRPPGSLFSHPPLCFSFLAQETLVLLSQQRYFLCLRH